jgi:GNAT superfamily N-acetyltransferase
MIRLLTESDAQNLDLIRVLVFNVNKNYSETEKEFWEDGVLRTNIEDFQKEIKEKQVAAYFEEGKIVGSINFEIKEEHAKFSILSVNLGAHGKGVGNALFDFMVDELKKDNIEFLHLELLLPRHYESDYKNFVYNWYVKKGFVPGIKRRTEDLDFFPSENLKIESDFIEMTKDLRE